ncbi:hypothetical protein LLG96_01845 [bacterium]|nr:hypothetical protein [bacterium]
MKQPEEILKNNPGSIIFARYADWLVGELRGEEAVEILKKGIEANPSYALGHSMLAQILHKRELYEKAAKEWGKSLDLDPQNPSDLLCLGKYYLQINQPQKAKKYLTAAARFEPSDEEVIQMLEQAVSNSGDVDDFGLSMETAGALSVVLGENEAIPETLTMDTDEAFMNQVEDEPVDMETLIQEMADTGTEQSTEEAGEIDILPPEAADLAESPETAGDFLAEDFGVGGSGSETLMAAGHEDLDIGMEETESEAVESLLTISSHKDAVTDTFEEEETEELAPEDELEELELEGSDIFGTGTEKDEEKAAAETAETVSDDFESLLGSFSGDDIVIEAPDEPEDSGEKAAEEKPAFIEVDEAEEEDIESLVESFSKEDIEIESPEAPAPEAVDDSPMGRLEDFGGIEIVDESGEGLSENLETGSGIVLDLDDTEEYTSSVLKALDDETVEPVLTAEERAELLALEKTTAEESADEIGAEKEEIARDADWDSPLKTLLDEYESSDETVEADEVIPTGFYGELSKEEIDILSENGVETEGVNKLELETREGIDYSDVLAEAAGKTVPDMEAVLDEIYIEEDAGIGEDEGATAGEKGAPGMILDMTQVEATDTILLDASDFPLDEELVISEEELAAESPDEADETASSAMIPEEPAEAEDEDFKRVEAIIKNIPDFEIPLDVEDEEEYDVSRYSLDTLMNEYRETLQDTEPSSTEPVMTKPENEGNFPEDYDTPGESGSTVVENDATATMAEIYVSQGFISRAVDIYKILVSAQPDNERFRKRLEELNEMSDQQSADS